LAVYAAATSFHSRVRWAHPVVVTCAALFAVLHVTHVRLENYHAGADYIPYLLGPATVALGVPMYKHARTLKRSLRVLGVSVCLGALVGMITAGLTAGWLGAPRELVMSAIPKSVTTPIAIEVARQLHGLPEVTAGMAVIAGLAGSIVCLPILRFAGVSNDLAVGAAMGTSSHAIGTARLLRESELQASVSSLAMAMAGIATSLFAIPIPWISRLLTAFHG